MDGTDVREQSDENSPAEQQSAIAVEAPREIEESPEVDGASLMEQFLSDPSHDYKTLKYGDVMDGIIMHLDREELLVDIGSKAEGIVPAKEYSSLSSEEKDKLEVGDNILVFVVQPENPEGHPVVSIDRARQEKSWRNLQDIHEANEVIEAEVTNYNKGGLLVNLDGVRGFVPASQVSEIRGGDESSKQADMARLIGSSLPLKVIEINRHRNRLILSERQAIQERRDEMKERLIGELKEGEVRKGRVSSICDFGAFVDIGGADGLVHLSELSWSRVRHPSELLKVGEDVDVYVLGINSQEKKIALSIKRTQAEPWSRVATSYEVGKLVRGTVTQVVNFGAFARIEDGIEGLIHVSELADERIQHPKQVVQEGQELILRIIRIDPQRRRMGLSLRRALDTPDEELIAEFGDDILEERDALVQRIRASLEAEGITSQVGDIRTSEDGESTAAAGGDADTTRESTRPTAPDQVAAFEERRQRAEEAAAAQRSQRDQGRRASRASSDTPAFEGEDMSAMAMAFAMAGADEDLLSATETAKRDSKSKRPQAKASEKAEVPAGDSSAPAGDGDEASAGDGNTETATEASVPVEVAAGPEQETPAQSAEEPAVDTVAQEQAPAVSADAEETAPAEDVSEASNDSSAGDIVRGEAEPVSTGSEVPAVDTVAQEQAPAVSVDAEETAPAEDVSEASNDASAGDIVPGQAEAASTGSEEPAETDGSTQEE